MNLSSNAWHARLYRRVNPNNTLPTNFCPYFWKTLLYVVTFPVLWLGLWLNSGTPYKRGFWTHFGTSLAAHFILFVLLFVAAMGGSCMGVLFFGKGLNWWQFGIGVVAFVVALALFCGAIISISLAVTKVSTWREKRKRRLQQGYSFASPPEDNFFVAGIKAWYKKHCPIVAWKENPPPVSSAIESED
jgi:hypothetical protein